MASQLAGILNDYRRTMPESGAGLADASRNYLLTSIKNKELEQEQDQNEFSNRIAVRKDQRETDKANREAEQAKLEKMAMAIQAYNSSGKDPSKLKMLQEPGQILEGIDPGMFEPIQMASVVGRAKIDRDMDQQKISNDQRNADRKYGLDKQKLALDQKKESRMSVEDELKRKKLQAEIKKLETDTGRQYEYRGSPLGLEGMILDKATKKPMFIVDMSGNVKTAPPNDVNTPMQPQAGGVVDYRDYFK